MSHFSGVQYEVPAYATGTAPTATMIPRTQSYNPHGDPNMDPSLTTMDPDLSQLMPVGQRGSTDFISSIQGQATPYQLQLQAAAANEAAIAGELQGAHAQGDLSIRAPPEAAKAKRLGRACDACSKRKVKCGEEVPCKNCVDLEIECTFSRPTKRRGPANRVAEDLKRQRMENGDAHSLIQGPFSQSPGLESIASYDKVQRLLVDFFTYLGPIYPFPPEALLLGRLERREDEQNKSLVALIPAMLALLATTFPRLISEAGITLSNEDFISRCTKLTWDNYSPPFQSLEIDDAATVFFLGIVSYLNGRTREFAAHMTSSLSIIRALGAFSDDEIPSDGLVADPVTKEFSLRIFWSIYTTARSIPQTPEIMALTSLLPASALPPLPTLSDTYSFIHPELDGSNQEKSTLIQGFNILVHASVAHHELYSFKLLNVENRALLHTNELAIINSSLQELEVALSTAHPELSALPASGYIEQQGLGELWSTPHLRAHIQTELLKIHLRAGLLRTRLFLAESLSNLQDGTSKAVVTQYVTITEELAVLLKNTSLLLLEPCRAFIAPILRSVLLALRDCPEASEQMAEEYEYLNLRFVELFGAA